MVVGYNGSLRPSDELADREDFGGYGASLCYTALSLSIWILQPGRFRFILSIDESDIFIPFRHSLRNDLSLEKCEVDSSERLVE